MFENYQIVLSVIGLFLTIFAAVWSLAWWLSGQFTALRNLIYLQVEKLNDSLSKKLEYHEKHDDARFSHIDTRLNNARDDLWDIRVRNASRDGLPPLRARDKPRNGDTHEEG